MKRLGCTKDFQVPTVRGLLDGRTELGGAPFSDYRVILNCGTNDAGRLKRLAGWRRLGQGNEDLHDQLLGAVGEWASVNGDTEVPGFGAQTVIDLDDASWLEAGDVLTYDSRTVTVVSQTDLTVTVRNDGADISMSDGDSLIRRAACQTEVVTSLFEATSSEGSRTLIACTNSRIYCSTGSAMNWRILADQLGETYVSGDTKWPSTRFDIAQVGDIILFANGFNNVLAWRLDGDPITGETTSYRRWSAWEVYDLQGLGITTASCVYGWNGFAFIGDVTVDGTRYSSRIYWSDFNRPLEWAPGGESIAGYYDLGSGQKILRISTLGGTLRVYTDKSVWIGEFVGGDVVFRFTEVGLGTDALKYRWSLINCGDSHFFLANDSLVEMRKYDTVPQRLEWYYKASGLIYNGLSQELLTDFPTDFSGFGAIDDSVCHQIAAGYDKGRREIWLSWPTVTDDDGSFDQHRRMTMVLNRKFGKCSLVDHPFSAFAEWTPDRGMSVRDFEIVYCICDAPGVVLDKEGLPLNNPIAQCDGPTYGTYEGPDWVVNPYESGQYATDIDSICALIGDLRFSDLCQECKDGQLFIAASLDDLTLKQFDQSYIRRDVYDHQSDVAVVFPETSDGSYSYVGFASVVQSEINDFGSAFEKTLDRTLIDAVSDDQDPPGQLRMQVTANNSPRCAQWSDSDPVELSCLNDQADPDDDEERSVRSDDLPGFAFYDAGRYFAYRLWVEGEPDLAGGDGPTEPVDCAFDLTQVVVRLRQRTQGWK